MERVASNRILRVNSLKNQEARELLKNHKGLILNQCAKYSKVAEFSELYGESLFAFTQAYQTYDPSKGAKFSTYLTWKLKGRLSNLYKKIIRRKRIEKMYNNRILNNTVSQYSRWNAAGY